MLQYYNNMNIKLLFTLFYFLLFSNYDYAGNINYPIVNNGNLSKITLLEISKIGESFLHEKIPGAKDGLAFFFLITKNEGVDGFFTLTETRDFQLNGYSYAESSKNSLKMYIEPHTIAEDASDFFSKIRPDLMGLVEESSDESSTVMMIFIGGEKLPKTGDVEFTIKVGWNKDVEPFNYKFNLSEIKDK